MAAILFHSFTIDDAIFPASCYRQAHGIFSVAQQHVAFLVGIDHSGIGDDIPLPISKFIVSKRFVS
jgi:hypothetical protein